MTRDQTSTNWRFVKLAYLIAPAVLVMLVLLWARSLLPSELFVFSRNGRLLFVFADAQAAQSFRPNQVAQGYTDIVGPYVNASINAMRTAARVHIAWPGFEWIACSLGAPDGECRIASISYVYPVSLAGALSAWSIAAMRRARPRWLDGHCRVCGYDLRGNSGSCPECGAGAERLSTGTLANASSSAISTIRQ